MSRTEQSLAVPEVSGADGMSTPPNRTVDVARSFLSGDLLALAEARSSVDGLPLAPSELLRPDREVVMKSFLCSILCRFARPLRRRPAAVRPMAGLRRRPEAPLSQRSGWLRLHPRPRAGVLRTARGVVTLVPDQRHRFVVAVCRLMTRCDIGVSHHARGVPRCSLTPAGQ